MPTYTKPTQLNWANRSTYTDSRYPGVVSVFNDQSGRCSVGDGFVNKVVSENPNWRSEVAQGVNASRPYSNEWFTCSTEPFDYKSKMITTALGGYTIDGIGKYYGFGAYNVSRSTEDLATREIALKVFKRRLYSNVQNAKVLAPGAELRELRGLVSQASGFTYQFLSGLAEVFRKHKGDSSRITHLAASSYLAWVFGMKPLIHDIKDAASAVQEWLLRYDKSVRVQSTFGTDWRNSYADPGDRNITAGFGCNLRISTVADHYLSYRYVGSYQILMESSNNYGILDHLGVSFRDIPAAAEELIPYSWILDYFTTTGEFLDDAFSSPPGTLKYLTLTKRYDIDATCVITANPWTSNPTDFYSVDAGEGGSWWKYGLISRTSLSTIPTLALRLRSMDEIGYHGVSKLLNLAAVLRAQSPKLKAGIFRQRIRDHSIQY